MAVVMVHPSNRARDPNDPARPWNQSPPLEPISAAEAERRRQEAERILKGLAGIVVAGVAVIGFAKFLSRALR